MARTTRIILPSSFTDMLLEEIRRVEGLLGVTLQRGGAVSPPGDVVTVESTTEDLAKVLKVLDDRGLLKDPSTTVTTSEPVSTLSPSAKERLTEDASNATLEEMELTIASESNATPTGLVLVAASSIIVTIGILTDALHLVLGGVIIAPVFEPISRIALGIVGQSRAWRRGVVHAAKAYGVLIAAAALTTLVFRLVDGPAGSAYLTDGALVDYWAKLSPEATVTAAAAGVAGAILIATHRSVLTGGVLIALGIVPAAVLLGAAIVHADLALFGVAIGRLALETALVILGSLAVYGVKRAANQRRRLAL